MNVEAFVVQTIRGYVVVREVAHFDANRRLVVAKDYNQGGLWGYTEETATAWQDIRSAVAAADSLNRGGL